MRRTEAWRDDLASDDAYSETLDLGTLCPTLICDYGPCGTALDQLLLDRDCCGRRTWRLCHQYTQKATPAGYAALCHLLLEQAMLSRLNGEDDEHAGGRAPGWRDLQLAAHNTFLAALAEAAGEPAPQPSTTENFKQSVDNWQTVVDFRAPCYCPRCSQRPLLEALDEHPDLQAQIWLPYTVDIRDVPHDTRPNGRGGVIGTGSQLVWSLLGLTAGPTETTVPLWVAYALQRIHTTWEPAGDDLEFENLDRAKFHDTPRILPIGTQAAAVWAHITAPREYGWTPAEAQQAIARATGREHPSRGAEPPVGDPLPSASEQDVPPAKPEPHLTAPEQPPMQVRLVIDGPGAQHLITRILDETVPGAWGSTSSPPWTQYPAS